mgnify:CR=1 FL=1
MKQKFILGAVALCLAVGLTSCGEKQEELTKMIPADAVTFSGKHKNLLTIPADVDSVKIMLVCADAENHRWDVRAVIPVQNTKAWSQIPGTDTRKSSYFEPRMGNLNVTYLDANESEIGDDLSMDGSVIESVLSSDDIITEKASVKDTWEYSGDKSYKAKRALFDKVAGISISNMELHEEKPAKKSSGKSSSTLSDIYEDALNEVADAYEDAINEAVNDYEDAVNGALEDILGL